MTVINIPVHLQPHSAVQLIMGVLMSLLETDICTGTLVLLFTSAAKFSLK